MQKFLLLALSVLIAIPGASFAQTVKLSVGSSYTDFNASYVNYFQQGNEVLAVKANKKQVVLQKINGETLSISSSQVFSDFPKGTTFDYATENNNRFYLVYSVAETKVNTTSYVREIDFTQGIFKEQGKPSSENIPYKKDKRFPASQPNAASLDLNTTASVRNVNTFEPTEDYVVSTGFYNKNINTSTAGGIFVVKKGNQGNTLDQTSTYDIPSAVINQYLGGKYKESNFAVKEVLSDKEENLTLISEDVSQQTVNYYTPKGTARTAHYTHYDDLLITKVDASGNLLWIKKLPKRQVADASEGQGQLSYGSFTSAKNYYVIFLDNAKNKNLSIDEAPVAYTDGEEGVLTAYEISKDKGAVRKINLLQPEDAAKLKGYKFSADKIISLDEKSFLLEFTKKGKQDVLVKVSLTE